MDPATNVVGLLRQPFPETHREAPPDSKGQRRMALLLGVLTIIGAAAVSFMTLLASREAALKNIYETNVRVIRLLAEYTNGIGAGEAPGVLAELEELWGEIRPAGSQSYLCAVSPDGSLMLHTARPEDVGRYVGDVPLRTPGGQGPGTLGELAAAPAEWIGRYTSTTGEEQVVAFAPAQRLGGLIAIHVPLVEIEHRVVGQMLPMATGLVLVTLGLLPLSLLLLHRAYVSSQRALIRDLTERKKAEGKLRRLEMAIEQASEVFLITDSAGDITYVNPAFEKVTGCRRDEAMGQKPGWPERGEAEGKEEGSGEIWETISGGETWTGRIAGTRKDGTRYTEETTISPIYSASGELAGYVSVGRDITEDLKLEMQLRQAQKMEAVGRLAGGVAHDFNNILQAILFSVDATIAELEADLGSSSPPLAGLRAIEEDAMRAAILTRQLLTFSRQDNSYPRALDLGRVLAEMKGMLRRLIPEDISLTMSLDPGLPAIYADRSRIEQIIMNLVINSKDAMPCGGKLILETACATLDEAQVATHGEALNGPHVLLSVSDTGIGMDPETRDRVFEPFFTTKEMGKGSGLGLATVYGIVKQAGGDILVYSEPGHGTTFRIYLPAIEATAEEPDERPDTAPALDGTETVLFCEDDERVRREAIRSLRGAGYTVLAAKNGEQALRLAAEHRETVDLLVTDVVMPDMNGMALVDALTAASPNLRTLFVSGYTADIIGQHGVLNEGMNFLAKPVRPRSLLRRVRELLDEPLSR